MINKSLKRVCVLVTAAALTMGLGAPQTASAADPFIAQIIMFGSNFAPRGWALCQGQLLPISQNTALFSLLGTIYGGDGETTFALPDLRGRSAVGAGTGPGLSSVQLGQRGGQQRVTISVSNLPSHTHPATTNVTSTLKATNAAGTSATPGANILASKGRTNIYKDAAPDVDMHAGSVASTATTTVGNTGGGQPIDVRDPYLGINYIIALVGTFPSQN